MNFKAIIDLWAIVSAFFFIVQWTTGPKTKEGKKNTNSWFVWALILASLAVGLR